jgi:exonuclease VII small subunit
MRMDKVNEARRRLDDVIKALDETQSTWSEAVAAEHMAAVHMKEAQRRVRDALNALAVVLNGDD